jgi:hypothetical protein
VSPKNDFGDEPGALGDRDCAAVALAAEEWPSQSTIMSFHAASEQRHAVRPGREVAQSRIAIAGKTYLLRVFVDVDRDPAEVVIAYRTSRIAPSSAAAPPRALLQADLKPLCRRDVRRRHDFPVQSHRPHRRHRVASRRLKCLRVP